MNAAVGSTDEAEFEHHRVPTILKPKHHDGAGRALLVLKFPAPVKPFMLACLRTPSDGFRFRGFIKGQTDGNQSSTP